MVARLTEYSNGSRTKEVNRLGLGGGGGGRCGERSGGSSSIPRSSEVGPVIVVAGRGSRSARERLPFGSAFGSLVLGLNALVASASVQLIVAVIAKLASRPPLLVVMVAVRV